jgi:hypothetical protein
MSLFDVGGGPRVEANRMRQRGTGRLAFSSVL